MTDDTSVTDLQVSITADTEDAVESIREVTEAVEDLRRAPERLEGGPARLTIEAVDMGFDVNSTANGSLADAAPRRQAWSGEE